MVIKCVPARFHQEEAHRWWAELSSSPLFKEISTAISKGKQTSGIAARLPKRPNIVVAIEIRGKAILVLNQTRTLTVAFEPGQELEGLQWLVEELEKDLETNTNLGENLENNEDLEEESEKDDEEQERHIDHLETQLRDQNLKALRDHDERLRASWPPSKPCYRVFNKQKTMKQFFVIGLKKRRLKFIQDGDASALESIKSLHQQAFQDATSWLDSFIDRPGSSAAASSSGPSSA